MMGRVGGVLGLGSLAQQSAGLSSWLPPRAAGRPPPCLGLQTKHMPMAVAPLRARHVSMAMAPLRMRYMPTAVA